MSTSRKPKSTSDSETSLQERPGATALLGARVAAARHHARLTLAATADRTGLSTAYLSQIESATANPTVRTLSQIAAALDTDVPALFGSDHASAEHFPAYRPAAPHGGLAGVWDRTAAGSTRLSARLVQRDAGDHASPVVHAGEELVVVVQGTCRLHTDGEQHDLSAGDTCHYDAGRSHHIDTTSDDLVVVVVLSESGTMVP